MHRALSFFAALACSLSTLAGTPLPLERCKVAVQTAPNQVSVLHGDGTALWHTAPPVPGDSASVSLSRDGGKLAFVPYGVDRPVTVVDRRGKRATFVPTFIEYSPDQVRWQANNDLLVIWEGHASWMYRYMTLKGWPKDGWPHNPRLVSVWKDQLELSCTQPVEGGEPVCASGYYLSVDDRTLARFNHQDTDIQPREGTTQAVIPLGTSMPVPGAPELAVRYAAFARGKAQLEVVYADGASSRYVSAGDEVTFNASVSTPLLVVREVSRSRMAVTFIQMEGEEYRFGELASVAPGVLLVEIRGAPEGTVEVWLRSGNAYVRRLRTSLPRETSPERMELTQPGVLSVIGDGATYEVPFTLGFFKGAVTALTFGGVVDRPSTVAGQKVLDWSCY